MLVARRKGPDYHLRKPGFAFALVKRLIDVAVAMLVLVAAAPVVGLCALWVLLIDGRPLLHRQWRAGRDGELFEMCKLRTMTRDAEAQGMRFARPSDPRVLRGCNWMRRSHADELPQLIHVLTGRMSLVGPRPERPEVIERLRTHLPQFEARLAAKPGITGLAQVRNGYSNDLGAMRRKLDYDLQYLQQRSVTRDLRLLLATVPKLWDRAAC